MILSIASRVATGLLLFICITHASAGWTSWTSYCADGVVGVDECSVSGGRALVTSVCVTGEGVYDETAQACAQQEKPQDIIIQCPAPIIKIKHTTPATYDLCKDKTAFRTTPFIEMGGASAQICTPKRGALLRRFHVQDQIDASWEGDLEEQLVTMAQNPLFDNQFVEYQVNLGDIDLAVHASHLQHESNDTHTASSSHFHEHQVKLDSVRTVDNSQPQPQMCSLQYTRKGNQISWKAYPIGAGPLIPAIGENFIATATNDPDDISRLNVFTIGGATSSSASNSLQLLKLRQTCSSDGGASTCLDTNSIWNVFQFARFIPPRMNALMVEISPSYFYWLGGIGANKQFLNDVYSLNFHDSHDKFRSQAEYTPLGLAPFSPRSSAAGGFLRHANDGTRFRGRVVVVGGATSNGISQEIWCGNLDYKGFLFWDTKPLLNIDPTLSQRFQSAFTVYRSKSGVLDTLFIAGGVNAAQQVLQDVWKINADLTYSKVADLPAARWGGSLLYVDRQLMYMGGYDANKMNFPGVSFAYSQVVVSLAELSVGFSVDMSDATYIFPPVFDNQIQQGYQLE